VKRDTSVSWTRIPLSDVTLAGWRVAVIGGTGGIGRELSRVLAAQGASVVVVGRTFRDDRTPRLTFIQADLSSMHEARRVAGLLAADTLDLAIFTTGIFAAPTRQETAEGIERDMAVSYLSRLVILRGMAPRLGTGRRASTGKPRVFIMGFPGTGRAGSPDDLNAEKTYGAMKVHMNTVADNEILVLDAADRYPNANVFGLNPGLIRTNIRDNLFGPGTLKSRLAEWTIGLVTPSAEHYAERVVPLLVSPDLEAHSGTIFDRRGDAVLASPQLTDTGYRQRFLQASEALVGRAGVHVTPGD
jgi:NAD(P)-dependent dehydrogenase (short-subunit alcohol dehydrogenase family)